MQAPPTPIRILTQQNALERRSQIFVAISVTKDLQASYDLRERFDISVLKRGGDNTAKEPVQPGVSSPAERDTAIVRKCVRPMRDEIQLLFKLILRKRA